MLNQQKKWRPRFNFRSNSDSDMQTQINFVEEGRTPFERSSLFCLVKNWAENDTVITDLSGVDNIDSGFGLRPLKYEMTIFFHS